MYMLVGIIYIYIYIYIKMYVYKSAYRTTVVRETELSTLAAQFDHQKHYLARNGYMLRYSICKENIY